MLRDPAPGLSYWILCPEAQTSSQRTHDPFLSAEKLLSNSRPCCPCSQLIGVFTCSPFFSIMLCVFLARSCSCVESTMMLYSLFSEAEVPAFAVQGQWKYIHRLNWHYRLTPHSDIMLLGNTLPSCSSVNVMATISLYASVFSYGKHINTYIHPPVKLLSRINELVFGLAPVIE